VNTLRLINERKIILDLNETIFQNDNKITAIMVDMPDVITIYPRADCQIELQAILPSGDYLPYTIETNEPTFEWLILNDLTETPQIIKLMMIITHQGNVIGRTNAESFEVVKPVGTVEPLTPREQFDTVIAEQRQTIQNQAETISEQTTEITEKDGQISELNGQVTELTSENTRLENLTDTQRETIQNMLDNPPQPKLYTPPEPIIPESETRVYTPPQNYDGFASFSVKGNKYLNANLQKFLARDIDFDLEIKADSVGDYLCYGQHGLINCRLTGSPIKIGAYAFQDCSSLQTINLPSSLTSIGDGAFQDCSSLRTINLPSGVTSIGQKAFNNCSSLQTINLPSSLTSIGAYAFYYCSSLQNVTIENGFNCNGLNVSLSTRFTAETIVACLEALADRTGQTAYTITFGSTNLNKLTAEQRAIATNKNWNLA
jgi:hypothetical protein